MSDALNASDVELAERFARALDRIAVMEARAAPRTEDVKRAEDFLTTLQAINEIKIAWTDDDVRRASDYLDTLVAIEYRQRSRRRVRDCAHRAGEAMTAGTLIVVLILLLAATTGVLIGILLGIYLHRRQRGVRIVPMPRESAAPANVIPLRRRACASDDDDNDGEADLRCA